MSDCDKKEITFGNKGKNWTKKYPKGKPRTIQSFTFPNFGEQCRKMRMVAIHDNINDITEDMEYTQFSTMVNAPEVMNGTKIPAGWGYT